MKSTKYNKDHLANERTYLAWIRTSIGVMAFGFVVERFSLFSHQFANYFKNTEGATTTPTTQSHSALFALALIVFGALIGILAFFEYRKTTRQIEEESYSPPLVMPTVLTIAILLIAIFLVGYLL